MGVKISNQTHISTSDPEAQIAGLTHQPKKLRYKTHHVMDSKSRVIVDTHITHGAVSEGIVFQDRIKETEKNIGVEIEEATADRGYGWGENLQFLKD